MSDPMSEASLSSSRSLGEEEDDEGDDEGAGHAEQDEEELEEDDGEDDDADEDEEDDDEGESMAGDMQMPSPLLHSRSMAEQPERLYRDGDGHNFLPEKQEAHDEDDEEDDEMDSDEAFMDRDEFDSANELAVPADESGHHGALHHASAALEIHSSAQDQHVASDDLLLEKEDMEAEVEANEEANAGEDAQPDWLAFINRPPEEDDGTAEEQAEFVRELERFFAERNMEFKHPKFYQENLNCLKLWRAVVRLGGHEAVTNGKLWRQVGDTFKPPKSCTTVSWSFRVFYKKALLEYERFKFGQLNPRSNEGTLEADVANEAQADGPQCRSPQPSFMPNLGRARRDAASRAMQGWHSQRLFGNGEIGDPIVKEKAPSSSVKGSKQLKISLLRRKKTIGFERGAQTSRSKGLRSHFESQAKDENLEEVDDPSYFSTQRTKIVKHDRSKQAWKWTGYNSINGEGIWVTDEGPEADWVKINVHKAHDCFEVYALVPGLLRDEVRIQCEPGGQLVIVGEPEERNSPWGITSFKKVINLPLPIDASQTSAVVTVHGQLFVRVPFSLSNS